MQWSKAQLSIIAIAAITSFMGTFLISSINIALPAIEDTFGLDAVQLSWVITSFLLASAMFLLPAGRWGDLLGVNRLFKAGIIIFFLSSLACGLAPSGPWLIACRFFQGFGAAFTSTTGPAILVSAFLPKYRGRVLGISVAAVYLGLAVGPFAGGIITQYLGWRYIFLISAAIGIFTSLLAFRFLGKSAVKAKASKTDPKGTLAYMAGLVLLVFGASRIPDISGWLFMGGGTLAMAGFWLLESHSPNPVIDTRLYIKNRLFAYSNLAALINYSATFAIIFLLSLYLQKIQGLSPRDAGTILIAQPIVMAIFSPISGRLSDRIQPRIFTSIGMAMCTLGLAAFSFLTVTTPVWLIIVMLAWVGFGFALFSSPNMNTIMSSVDKTQYGLASGSAATMRVIGQIVSMTIATLFFATMFGNMAVDKVADLQFMKMVRWAFITFAVISISGIYFSLNRGNIERGD